MSTKKQVASVSTAEDHKNILCSSVSVSTSNLIEAFTIANDEVLSKLSFDEFCQMVCNLREIRKDAEEIENYLREYMACWEPDI